MDTSAHVAPGALDRYLTGRPLDLNVGGEVIKVPTVARPQHLKGGPSRSGGGSRSGDEELARLPPSDVPEHLLFAAIQALRPSLVAFADALPAHRVAQQLGIALGTALRLPNLGLQAWVQRPWPSPSPAAAGSSSSGGWGTGRRATGRWDAAGAELSIDLQTTEVLWRHDELKPVPDSMAQFADYASLFGKQPLHCGLVVRQEHRHWVHLVGSE